MSKTEYYLCFDESGGMCDRVCIGKKGVINNANVSIECWNDGYTKEDDEYMDKVKDFNGALSVLFNDNFTVWKMEKGKVYVVSGNTIVTYGNQNIVNLIENYPNEMAVINIENVKFTDGMYSIY